MNNAKNRGGRKEIRADNPNPQLTREEKLAKQLRQNLAKRKSQSKARNTRPRKFKQKSD